MVNGSKRMVFTINNPSNDVVCALERLMKSEITDYGGYQWEQGASGTVHIQGSIVFKMRITKKRASDLLEGVMFGCKVYGCRCNFIEIDSRDSTPELSPSPVPELVN